MGDSRDGWTVSVHWADAGVHALVHLPSQPACGCLGRLQVRLTCCWVSLESSHRSDLHKVFYHKTEQLNSSQRVLDHAGSRSSENRNIDRGGSTSEPQAFIKV